MQRCHLSDGTEIGDPTETALVRFAQIAVCPMRDAESHARISEFPLTPTVS
ncbi:MAG: hypothetical protein ACLT3Y_02655 [Ruminococcus callidus]